MKVKTGTDISRRCLELSFLFSEDFELWKTYSALAKGVDGIDVDAEFVSKPVRNYINFVGNQVRDWFCRNAPDLTSDDQSFDCFHRLISESAKRIR